VVFDLVFRERDMSLVEVVGIPPCAVEGPGAPAAGVPPAVAGRGGCCGGRGPSCPKGGVGAVGSSSNSDDRSPDENLETNLLFVFKITSYCQKVLFILHLKSV